jgi:hypothetical protein
VRLDTAFCSRLASVGFTAAAGKLPGCRLRRAGDHECVTQCAMSQIHQHHEQNICENMRLHRQHQERQYDLADASNTMLMMPRHAHTARHTLGRGRPRVSGPAVRRGMSLCMLPLKPWRSAGPDRPHSAAIGTTHRAAMAARCWRRAWPATTVVGPCKRSAADGRRLPPLGSMHARLLAGGGCTGLRMRPELPQLRIGPSESYPLLCRQRLDVCMTCRLTPRSQK